MYGDIAATHKRVGQLREQGQEIRVVADRLVAQAEAVPWHGRAAESMRARVQERANQLRAAASRHDTAADSLARHLVQVEELKDSIEVREHKARTLINDAQTRAARSKAANDEPAAADRLLIAFSPPPSGHRDWLTVELPGL